MLIPIKYYSVIEKDIINFSKQAINNFLSVAAEKDLKVYSYFNNILNKEINLYSLINLYNEQNRSKEIEQYIFDEIEKYKCKFPNSKETGYLKSFYFRINSKHLAKIKIGNLTRKSMLRYYFIRNGTKNNAEIKRKIRVLGG